MRCVSQAEQVIQRLLTVSDNSTNHPTEEPLSLAGFQPASSLEKQSLLRRFDCRGGEDTLVCPASVLREPD